MAGGFEDDHAAVRQIAVYKLADFLGSDYVVLALKDKRWNINVSNVSTNETNPG
jgi:hypothetical protein